MPLIIKALVLRAIQDMGSLTEHLFALSGVRVSDSALSQRRAALPFALFERLFAVALRARATLKAHPQAFYAGLRLVGIDGTEFSAPNCPAIVAALGKAASRRFAAAFAKVGVCLLVELGAHNPLAAALGDKGEKEYALARRLLAHLPAGCLLLADRLYGVGAFLSELRAHWPEEKGHFLVRARANLARKFLRGLRDGSALVELSVREKWRAPGAAGKLLVREIQGRVRRPGCAWTSVRLFTSLLDEQAHPARVLLELYARRWEHELAHKELKLDLRSTPLLASHTPATAVQEIAALVLAQSLLAEARLEVAAKSGLADPLTISFAKLRHHLEGIINVAALAEAAGLPLSGEQLDGLWQALCKQLFWRRRKGARRARTCARGLRQPVSSWPRLVQSDSHKGPVSAEVLAIKQPKASKKAASKQK